MAGMAKWRRPTVVFKRQVVERMKTRENIHALARELKIERKLLYTLEVPVRRPPRTAGREFGNHRGRTQR